MLDIELCIFGKESKQIEYNPPLSLLWHCGIAELKC